MGVMNLYHKNPRQITERQYTDLQRWLGELGDLSGIVHDLNTDEVIGGNQRSRVFDINNCEIVVEHEQEPDKQGTVGLGYVIWQGHRYGYRQVRWTEKQCEQANIVANKAGGKFDFDLLANEFELDELLEWGFNESDFQLDWGDDGDESEGEPDLTRHDVPDALWPTDNEWGIPLLDATLQASAVELPVSLWGAVQRKARMRGTWLFYCDDYRFEALWSDPSDVVNTQCRAVVEPNFTVGPQTPKAVALWQVYRKRWLARWWQSFGIRTLVDVNIDMATFADIALLGVPEGWKAYATRGYSDRIGFTIMEYEAAKTHAGCEPLFLLYGGGKACQELAKERGWVYISEHMDQKRGGVVDG